MVWKKQTFEVAFGPDQKVVKLKEHIQTLTGLVVVVCMVIYHPLAIVYHQSFSDCLVGNQTNMHICRMYLESDRDS